MQQQVHSLPAAFLGQSVMAVQGTSEPVLDIEGTLARFGGDKQLFVEMSGIVLEDAPRVLADLRRAVETHDAPAVRAHAHAIRGLFAGCGGARAAHAAQMLEDAGSTDRLEQSSSMLETLESEFATLERALTKYRQ